MTTLGTGAEDMAKAAAARDGECYILRLFVAGTSAHSSRAIVNIRKICEEHLAGRYELEIVDLAIDPSRAEGDQIIAAPTLLRVKPLPQRRFIGDLSRTERILAGLDLQRKPAQ